MTASSGSTTPVRVAGLLSGTSIDAIDVAVAELAAVGGELGVRPLGHWELPYPGPLRDELIAALPPNPCTAERLTRLDTRVGQAFAEALLYAERQVGPADVAASLGQTLYHWVSHGTVHGSLQLGQPAWIAERTGLPVVADLRVRDIAAGGHGAPLAGTFDALWLRPLGPLAERDGSPVAALNIGGIANLTVVHPDGDVLAFDTGPGNALLDVATHRVTGGARDHDTDGEIARRGTVRTDLLLADPFYAAQSPKSTGKERFHAGYLDDVAAELPSIGDADLLATLTELTAATIADACTRYHVRAVIASGGRIRNPALIEALQHRLDVRVSDELGLPADAKEAYVTAVLGWLTWHGVPGNVPGATGARGARMLGNITPGDRRLALPAPPQPPVTRLRVASTPETR